MAVRVYDPGYVNKNVSKSSPGRDCATMKKEKEVVNSGGNVPDGGWGWLVVLGVSLSNMTTVSLVSVFGFLFSQRLRELGIETSGTAVILSVQSTVLNLSGLFTGSLIRAFSYQKVAFSGSLLMVAGLLLTTFADSLTSYILTYGLFTGLGLGFLYPSTFVAVNSYFSTKKGIAVGWSVTGTGVGQMLLPLLVSYLLDEFGFRGTILILAAISGHSIVASLLYQPVSWHVKKPTRAVESKDVKIVVTPPENLSENNNTPVKMKEAVDNSAKGVHGLTIRRLSEPRNRSSASLHSIELDDSYKEINQLPKANPDEKAEEKKGFWGRTIKSLDYGLLKDGHFLIVIIGCGVVYTANTSFQMLYPLFLENMMFTRQEVATCMVTLSAFDIVGRPILPYIVKIFQLRAKTIFFFSAFLSAIIRSGVATQSKILPILILSAVAGLFRSAIITNMNLSVAEETSRDKLPAALGLQMVSKGITSMALGPLIGLIRDKSQSFSLCIHILSIFFLIVPFIAFLLEKLCSKPKKPS